MQSCMCSHNLSMGCQYLTKHQNYECTNHCMHVSLTSALQPQQTGGFIGFSSVENLSAWTNLPYSSVTVLKAKTQLWGQPKQYMLGALSFYPLHVHDDHLNNILRLDHLGWSIHCYKWECLECLAWGMQEGQDWPPFTNWLPKLQNWHKTMQGVHVYSLARVIPGGTGVLGMKKPNM